MKTTQHLKIEGIIPPLVTPLEDNDTLDHAGLEKLIEHVISGGVHGIFILGTTGEFSGLSFKLKNELIERTCRLVNNRVPVLVGIADCAYNESLNLARKAADSGADALVVLPPFYFYPSQKDLLGYITRLTAQLPLPLFLYNIPVHTKVGFTAETLRQAAEIPGIVGLKDSSSDLAFLNQVRYRLKDFPDFVFLAGPEEFLAEFILSGGHGGINGGANLFPKLYVNMYNAARARDFDKIDVLQQKVMQVCSTLYTVGNTSSSYLRGLKCALEEAGICSGVVAEPFRKFEEPERSEIRKNLEALGYRELL